MFTLKIFLKQSWDTHTKNPGYKAKLLPLSVSTHILYIGNNEYLEVANQIQFIKKFVIAGFNNNILFIVLFVNNALEPAKLHIVSILSQSTIMKSTLICLFF